MDEKNTAATGLSTGTPGADRLPKPPDGDTTGPRPSATPTANAPPTAQHVEDAATAGGPTQPAAGHTTGEATAEAGPTAALPATQASSGSTVLPRRPLTRSEAIVGILAILAWVILAAAGVAVPTKPHIDLIGGTNPKATILDYVISWFLVITCYTFTNIAILCCLSAVIGALGRNARLDDVERNDPPTDLRTLCIPAMIRGFFIFMVVLSGTLVLSEQEYDNITISQYLKLAGLVSLLSFAIGYDPHLFVAFFQRVSQWTTQLPSQSPRP